MSMQVMVRSMDMGDLMKQTDYYLTQNEHIFHDS